MAFRDPSTMRKHVKRHSSERPYSCETCGKLFASTYDMRKHSRIHLNDEERPYKCEVLQQVVSALRQIKSRRAYTVPQVQASTSSIAVWYLYPECKLSYIAIHEIITYILFIRSNALQNGVYYFNTSLKLSKDLKQDDPSLA